jgi:hypothetical protein
MTRDSIRRRAGIGLAAVFGVLALFPAYWAAGGTWGLMEAMGDPEPFRPPTWMMSTCALLLLGWMMVVFGAMGLWGNEAVRRFCRLGCCVIALALLGVASDFFRSDSAGEQMVFGPVVLLLATVAAVLVRAEPRTPRLLPW